MQFFDTPKERHRFFSLLLKLSYDIFKFSNFSYCEIHLEVVYQQWDFRNGLATTFSGLKSAGKHAGISS